MYIFFQKCIKKLSQLVISSAFVADYERKSGNIYTPEVLPPNHMKVAVIGSGPAGLAAAGDLIKYGYDVTVFEALHDFGGVLKYGIPEFRLPNDIIDLEINNLRKWVYGSKRTLSPVRQ